MLFWKLAIQTFFFLFINTTILQSIAMTTIQNLNVMFEKLMLRCLIISAVHCFVSLVNSKYLKNKSHVQKFTSSLFRRYLLFEMSRKCAIRTFRFKNLLAVVLLESIKLFRTGSVSIDVKKIVCSSILGRRESCDIAFKKNYK